MDSYYPFLSVHSMRQLFLFLFLLGTAGSVEAQQGNISVLKLRLSDRSPIAVSLDGRYIDQGTTSLTMDGIRPGIHRIEIYADNDGRRPVRVFTGTLRLRAGTVNIGIVDVYNRGLKLRTRPLDDGDIGERDRVGSRSSLNRNSNNEEGHSVQEEGGDREDRSDPRDDVYDGGRVSDNGEGYGSFPRGRENHDEARRNAMSQADIDDLRQRVSSLTTDSDKEQLLKRALQDDRLYSDQVRQMLGWLSFESTRLEFAIWAYDHVMDQENYWKLEDTFDFSSSKKEFKQAIK
jgi:hypothetical protein